MNDEQPLSREELRKLRPSLRNLYILRREHLTGTQKLAAWITDKVGSMGFFYAIIVWTLLWFAWNIFGPVKFHFDSFPFFFVWALVSSMIQLILMPIIMVGQNLQGHHADIRAEADFELNQIAEKEIDTILIHLERQNALMLEILKRLEEQSAGKKSVAKKKPDAHA
ncbi:MAG: DUF1003 domain-containing protein [Patescibacteria group bacterium]|nr:DUF1003 domain-containing protein [Patescibacteria group bacterium]MDE1945940.1 DUF1003 domain-containing protein [Patescibacteria group bacterium]